MAAIATFLDTYAGQSVGTIRCEFEGREGVVLTHGDAVSMVGELAYWVAKNGSVEQKAALRAVLEEVAGEINA